MLHRQHSEVLPHIACPLSVDTAVGVLFTPHTLGVHPNLDRRLVGKANMTCAAWRGYNDFCSLQTCNELLLTCVDCAQQAAQQALLCEKSKIIYAATSQSHH